jgi:hypothetical protein
MPPMPKEVRLVGDARRLSVNQTIDVRLTSIHSGIQEDMHFHHL